MIYAAAFAAFVGYVFGLQVGKGKGEAYRAYIQRRLDDAEALVRDLEFLIDMARDKTAPGMKYIEQKITAYKRTWVK